jgi:hypothetical protein
VGTFVYKVPVFVVCNVAVVVDTHDVALDSGFEIRVWVVMTGFRWNCASG